MLWPLAGPADSAMAMATSPSRDAAFLQRPADRGGAGGASSNRSSRPPASAVPALTMRTAVPGEPAPLRLQRRAGLGLQQRLARLEEVGGVTIGRRRRPGAAPARRPPACGRCRLHRVEQDEAAEQQQQEIGEAHRPARHRQAVSCRAPQRWTGVPAAARRLLLRAREGDQALDGARLPGAFGLGQPLAAAPRPARRCRRRGPGRKAWSASRSPWPGPWRRDRSSARTSGSGRSRCRSCPSPARPRRRGATGRSPPRGGRAGPPAPRAPRPRSSRRVSASARRQAARCTKSTGVFTRSAQIVPLYSERCWMRGPPGRRSRRRASGRARKKGSSAREAAPAVPCRSRRSRWRAPSRRTTMEKARGSKNRSTTSITRPSRPRQDTAGHRQGFAGSTLPHSSCKARPRSDRSRFGTIIASTKPAPLPVKLTAGRGEALGEMHMAEGESLFGIHGAALAAPVAAPEPARLQHRQCGDAGLPGARHRFRPGAVSASRGYSAERGGRRGRSPIACRSRRRSTATRSS